MGPGNETSETREANVSSPIILREANGVAIRQSIKEGYLNATDMCQAWGKYFADWRRTKSAEDYLTALELTMGIPIVKLIVSLEGRFGGTWVHPLLGNRLAQWCNPVFAVTVDKWIEELKHGHYPQAHASDPAVLPIVERHELQIKHLDGRVSAIEGPKREKRNRHHDRLIRRAVRRMGGKCPCGCGRQMLKPNGDFVEGVQIDHWNELRGDNRLANKWPLFQECHTAKHQKPEEVYAAFVAFQRILKKVEEDETKIVPPSPFAKRIIDELNAKRFNGPNDHADQHR
jgi:hypothetical protein